MTDKENTKNNNNKKDVRGKNNPMFHKTHSDEVKKKISKKIKAMWDDWNKK